MTFDDIMGLGDLTGKVIKIRGNLIGLVTEMRTEIDRYSGMDGMEPKAWIHLRLGNEPARSYTNEQFWYEEVGNDAD